jgi:elongation factor P
MALPEHLRKFMLIRHKGEVYYVLDYYESKAAQQKAVVHVKLKNVRTGHVSEIAADALGKIEEARSSHRLMQYLYARGKEHVFMDEKTFDQISLQAEMMQNELPFLVPEKEYRVLFLDERPVMLELPPTVSLKVTETAPPQRSVGGSSVYKDAKLETGVTVKVPLFIKVGDVIRVGWANREYLGKES